MTPAAKCDTIMGVMKEIKNQSYSMERALYAQRDALVEDCRFEGEEDGESFLKECENVVVKNCYMDLRYPLWHAKNLTVLGGEMTERCRAALWYDEDLHIEGCRMNGIKALRECQNVTIRGGEANSPEFGWRCKNLDVADFSLTSEYAFFESKNLHLTRFELHGKYSFQYVETMTIEHSRLRTKDAFWHTKNVTVKDSLIDGEYLGWYSEGLTLIDCHIRGTQPLCYCKGLRLIRCTMEDCDLAFEYSDVEADIDGEVLSVKNPLSGTIRASSYGQIILENSKYPTSAKILKK